uniref:AMP-dependent synthetase/ligase domain-containing protein n=1 Tax=Attheya septentrionalis TaxID=420275 RepID=A0A7S2UH56_9STRA|mmetsp:Transcript_25798/g.46699  ORF Transcript_25798/g.46699 Transcript_25798/m.46699 type:complete len:458 (+) Transcript_25798:94-1467(+)
MIHLHSLAARKSSIQIVRPLATLIRKTLFSTGGSEVEIEDVCDLHIVESPYPPIQAPPYPPLSEFVMADWQSGNLREKIACVDGSTGQTRTFQDHTTNVAKIAAALKNEFGIKETSTVALFSPNHVDFIPISLGVATTGAKLTPINPLYKIMELVVVLEQSRSEVLISHEATMDVALEAAKHVKCIRHVIIIPRTDGGPVPEGTTSIDDLKKYKYNLKETVRGIHVDGAKHPFLLPYSSGTTGLPKGVCLSHNNLISNLLQFDEIEGMSFPTDHKLISPLPFFHIYGFLVSGLYCAWRGQELITISGRFDLEQFCQLVEEHKPKRAHLVPPILLGLANDPIVDKYDMSSLKMIISAAAPLSSDIEKTVTKRIDSDVKQGWGMSELSPLGTVNSDYNSKTGSIGQLAPSTYGKIVDPKTLKSLKPNEAGELMIKVRPFYFLALRELSISFLLVRNDLG